MGRGRKFAVMAGAAAAAVAVAGLVRHGQGSMGREAPGGILIGDAGLYDAFAHRLFLGSLFRRVATDVASVVDEGARLLEIGCGPGRLSILLAKEHGLDVTGVDLDPAMIARARSNAGRAGADPEYRPSFMVGNAAALPFPDNSFDVVFSTLSMHHWADPKAGIEEIGRVLCAGGRALIWDFRAGAIPLHGHLPDPADHARGTSMRLVSATPLSWPWRFKIIKRVEFASGTVAVG